MVEERTVFERYKIIKELQRNAVTVSYLALDLIKECNCILRELKLRIERLDFWEIEKEFEKQAKILSHLRHGGILNFVDYFIDDTGKKMRVILVQEYREGKSLSRYIEEGRFFTEKEIAGYTREIIKILEYLHGFSPPVLHRNINPDNILIAADGKVFLRDFGIFKDRLLDDSHPSGAGAYYGHTPMEEFQGNPQPASDIYALGTSMIFALSRKDPLETPDGVSTQEFRKQMKISDPFHKILMKMVQPELKNRYTDIGQLKSDMDRLYLQYLSKRGPGKGHMERIAPKRTSKKVVAGSILLAVLVCASFMVFYILNKGTAVEPVSPTHTPPGPIETTGTPVETEEKAVLPSVPEVPTEVTDKGEGKTDAEEKTSDAGQTWANAKGTWFIGCGQGTGNSGLKKQDHFTGLIDELRIYNRALSESDIDEIYSHEKPEPTSIEIHMKNGKVITLENFWEDETQIKYELYGGIVIIQKNNIEKIIRK